MAWAQVFRANGGALRELRSNASVFGTSGNVSFGIDAYYRDDPGDRLNSEANLQELYGQLKWQPTPDDVFYFLGKMGGPTERGQFRDL